MTKTNPPSTDSTSTSTDPTSPDPTSPDGGAADPRTALAIVVSEVERLMAGTAVDQIANPTPCPDFTVKELNEHLILVLRRVAAIGRGAHWSSVTEEAVSSGWLGHLRAAADDMQQAWEDPAKLDGLYEVPWGTMPAAPMLATYVAEIAVHGWDLATATNQRITIDDEVLRPSLGVVQFGLPAEGRESPEMPFDPVVDPGPDAPVLDHLAGWLGRAVR